MGLPLRRELGLFVGVGLGGELVAYKYNRSFWFKTIADDIDDCIEVTILLIEMNKGNKSDASNLMLLQISCVHVLYMHLTSRDKFLFTTCIILYILMIIRRVFWSYFELKFWNFQQVYHY